jgi:hypothetical protein
VAKKTNSGSRAGSGDFAARRAELLCLSVSFFHLFFRQERQTPKHQKQYTTITKYASTSNSERPMVRGIDHYSLIIILGGDPLARFEVITEAKSEDGKAWTEFMVVEADLSQE